MARLKDSIVSCSACQAAMLIMFMMILILLVLVHGTKISHVLIYLSDNTENL